MPIVGCLRFLRPSCDLIAGDGHVALLCLMTKLTALAAPRSGGAGIETNDRNGALESTLVLRKNRESGRLAGEDPVALLADDFRGVEVGRFGSSLDHDVGMSEEVVIPVRVRCLAMGGGEDVE